MAAYRQSLGLSVEQMAQKIGVGRHLLEMIENGSVTHPDIAKQIGEGYGLTEDEYQELIPPNRRVGGEEYDPEKFKMEARFNRNRVPIGHADCSEIDKYTHDCFLKIKKKKNRRKR